VTQGRARGREPRRERALSPSRRAAGRGAPHHPGSRVGRRTPGSALGLLPLSETVAKKKHKGKGKRHRNSGNTSGNDSGTSTGNGPDPDASPPCVACGAGCCDRSSCFAEKVSDEDRRALSHACCPAAALCLSTTPTMPDQCCYPDEVCDASFSRHDPNTSEGLCCRSCAERCCESFEECQDGVCIPLTTARLPRTRRP